MVSISYRIEFLENRDVVGFISILSAQNEAGLMLDHQWLLAEVNSTEWHFSSLLITPRQMRPRLL